MKEPEWHSEPQKKSFPVHQTEHTINNITERVKIYEVKRSKLCRLLILTKILQLLVPPQARGYFAIGPKRVVTRLILLPKKKLHHL